MLLWYGAETAMFDRRPRTLRAR